MCDQRTWPCLGLAACRVQLPQQPRGFRRMCSRPESQVASSSNRMHPDDWSEPHFRNIAGIGGCFARCLSVFSCTKGEVCKIRQRCVRTTGVLAARVRFPRQQCVGLSVQVGVPHPTLPRSSRTSRSASPINGRPAPRFFRSTRVARPCVGCPDSGTSRQK